MALSLSFSMSSDSPTPTPNPSTAYLPTSLNPDAKSSTGRPRSIDSTTSTEVDDSDAHSDLERTTTNNSTTSTAMSSLADQEDAYFSNNPPPRALDAHIAQAQAFIAKHVSASRRVVLITSGGTTVPLERQTVRFIDNFSAGTRGATSAEYFLSEGYAVIFLHREFSLVPYARHYSHATTGSFLDFLEDDGQGGVRARQDVGKDMGEVLRAYKKSRDEDLLLTIPFVTIGDYLHELRAMSRLMAPLGPSGLLYLAAAVSDFFVPHERMPEHKIQSTDAAKGMRSQEKSNGNGNGNGKSDEEEFDNFDATSAARSKRLVIDLDPVPKFLKSLVDGWAPQGMIASYKLETDPAILVHKARYSLDRYQHHLVIGNLLPTRKWEVVFVSPGREDNWLRVPKKSQGGDETDKKDGWSEEDVRKLQAGQVPKEEPGMDIEALIIPAVRELHDEHMKRQQKV